MYYDYYDYYYYSYASISKNSAKLIFNFNNNLMNPKNSAYSSKIIVNKIKFNKTFFYCLKHKRKQKIIIKFKFTFKVKFYIIFK